MYKESYRKMLAVAKQTNETKQNQKTLELLWLPLSRELVK
jgi:hypothetical protein